MMLKTLVSIALMAGSPCLMAAGAGQQAPDFSATDSEGKSVRLSEYQGRYVVLEWTNPECPFVRNQYNAKRMQESQAEWGGRGVVWLSINSSNKSSGEYTPPDKMNEWMRTRDAKPQRIVIDGASDVARRYSAKTTPEMVVIDPAGKIIYSGAIDDKPTKRVEVTRTANNYVRAALTEAMAGKPVTIASSTPYGCSIKY